jgi:NAD(P)-dependent dehydrogenase (short-subunit alcohol dehydrogenase family)
MSKTSVPIQGRVIAITGGARGIGLATAKQLHASGARVAIGDIDGDAAATAAAELGPGVVAGTLDVSDQSSFREFLDLVERELGPLDVLINNAGIMPIGPMLQEPEATQRRVFQINVLGVMNGMKLALPGMIARGGGHMVNMASVAGRSPVPGGASYAAAKAAVVSLTETARVEFSGTGVEFTCVMPSFTATELIAGTKGTKFIANVTPEAVAGAITAAVETPVADVFVPKSVGVIIKTQPLIGRRVRDAINHFLGADRTFLDVDTTARAAYDARISRPVHDEVEHAAGRDISAV